MRNAWKVVPALALAALTACGSLATTARIDLDLRPGWNGTVEVLVHRPDGSLVSRALLNGSVDLPIDDGDSVTIAMTVHAEGATLLSDLATYTSVARGDTIHVVAVPNVKLEPVPLQLPAVPGITAWSVSTPLSQAWLSGSDSNFTIDVPSEATSTPILAVALSGTDSLGEYGAPSASIGTGGIAVTDVVATSPTTVTITGNSGTKSPTVGGAVYLGNDYVDSVSVYTGGDVLPMPIDFGPLTEVAASSDSSAGSVSVGQVFSGAPPAAVSLDVSGATLPVVSNGQLTASSASWKESSGGGNDITYVSLEHYDNSSGSIYWWNVAVPPGTTQIALPALPADLASPAPYESSWVMSVDEASVDGYHEFIGSADAPVAGARWQYRSSWLVPPPTGGAAARAPSHLSRSLERLVPPPGPAIDRR